MIISKAHFILQENMDTDQIVPARFLKQNSKEGFGKYLFCDLRTAPDGSSRADIPVRSGDRSILVAGKNFGCGSSREHAAWALLDFGYKAVVSPYFSDIFRNNALNNGLLPVQISESGAKDLAVHLNHFPDAELQIDLDSLIFCVPGTSIRSAFPVDPFRKHCLMNGLDPIDYLVGLREKISHFENAKRTAWIQ